MNIQTAVPNPTPIYRHKRPARPRRSAEKSLQHTANETLARLEAQHLALGKRVAAWRGLVDSLHRFAAN